MDARATTSQTATFDPARPFVDRNTDPRWRVGRLAGCSTVLLVFALLATIGERSTEAASARSQNFLVKAPSRALADEIAHAAEAFRRQLAVEWLGHELPAWTQPCPIVAHVDESLGAGGRTSFMFRQRTPFGWEMEIQGSRQRILDSVLPHEVTHTIFATHFGRPLPRWADEGACTMVEHSSERGKQEGWLIEFLKSERGIPFNQMFAMTEYPGDMMPLYAQGYSVARYLIAQGGKPKFAQFVGLGLDSGNWTSAVRQLYGYDSLGDLQLSWVDWVVQGSRDDMAVPSSGIQLASAQIPVENAMAPRPANTSRVDQSQLASATSQPRTAARNESTSWYARRERRPNSDDERSEPRSLPVTAIRTADQALPADGWRSKSFR